MSSGNSSSFSMPQNQEKKQIPRYEVRFTNKNHPFMWLVCKTRAKILLSDPETSLTTPRLLPLRRSRRSYGNYQSSQSFVSSRIFLKRLGRSGRSYRKQALDVLSGVVNNKSTGNFQFSDASVLASMGSRLALPSGKNPTFPERREWPYTTKTEEGLPTSDFRLTTYNFPLPTSEEPSRL